MRAGRRPAGTASGCSPALQHGVSDRQKQTEAPGQADRSLLSSVLMPLECC